MLSGQAAPVVPALGYGPLTEQQWTQHLRMLSLQLPGGPLNIPLVYQGAAQTQRIWNAEAGESGLESAWDLEPSAVALQGSGELLRAPGQTVKSGGSYYSLELSAGQVATMLLRATGWATLNLSIHGEDGNLLALGGGAEESYERFIRDFTAPVNGTYYVRVGDYENQPFDLTVARSATLEQAGNNSPGTAQDITRSGQVLGSMDASVYGVEDRPDDTFSYNLYDTQGYRWDLRAGGVVRDGENDAFDGGLVREGFPQQTYLKTEADWREAFIGPYQLETVSVARKIAALEGGGGGGGGDSSAIVESSGDIGFARFLEFVTNTTDAVVQHTITIETNLGSDLQTRIIATSDGDTTLSSADRWIVTDDEGDDDGDPAILHYFGGAAPSSATLVGDRLRYTYDLTLQPGETQVIIHFAAQARQRADAITTAEVLSTLGGGALGEMTVGERGRVVNWDLGGLADYYRFEASEGDALEISAMPFNEDAVSTLEVALELLAPDGSVAAGEGEALDAIAYTVPAGGAGAYRVRLTAINEGEGSYTLAVAGATGTAAGTLLITGATVGDGQVRAAFPAAYRVDLSGIVRADSVNASDLLVNGEPAAAFTIIDGDTIEFEIAGAQAGDGIYTIRIAEGAFTGLDGALSEAFETTFEIAGPDLVVTDLSYEVLETTIKVTWTVKNEGASATTSYWYDLAIVSPDPSYNPGSPNPEDRSLFTYFRPQEPVLQPGESYTMTQEVQRGAVPGGNRFLILFADGYSYQIESNELNNLAVVPTELTAPDLRITAAAAPEAAVVGQAVSISWSVENIGSLPISSPWYDVVYISDDAEFGTGDQAIFNRYTNDLVPLAAGGSYSPAVQMTIPASVTPGSRYLLFVTNGYSSIGEMNRGNNTIALPIELTAPDLVVTTATAPASVVAGQSVQLSWTVANQSGVTAPGQWYDYVYLSGDALHDPQDTYIGAFYTGNNTPLAGGASYSNSQSLNLPGQAGAGTWYLLVVAGQSVSDTDPSSNMRAVEIAVSAPDLVVTSATSPAKAGMDQDVEVIWTVQNQGNVAAAGFQYDYVYLSRDAVYDSSDESVGSQHVGSFAPLAPGASYTATREIWIDSDEASPGMWYLLFVADRDNYQAETDETNNVFAVPVEIGKADLVVTSATAPATAQYGSSFNVSWTVENQGEFPVLAEYWYDAVYLSDDPWFDWDVDDYFDDVYLPDFSPLAPGGTYTANLNVAIQNSYGGGNRYLLFVADAWEYLGETEKNNNVVAVPISIPAPDLVVTEAAAPATVTVGQSVQISWTAQNQSAAPTTSTSWRDAFYISDDPEWNDDKDTYIGQLNRNSSVPLGADASYDGLQTVTIPSTTLGQRYLLVVTNSRGDQGEADETNNVLALPLSISAPDLSVTAANAPANAAVGQTIALDWTVTNVSDVGAPNVNWSDRVYLSQTATFDGGGRLLATRSPGVGSIAAGGAYAHVHNVTLPPEIAPGEWYLLFMADGGSNQGETNEANNLLAVPISLTAPDLVVSSVTALQSALVGTPISISWTVTNAGDAAATAPYWYDVIYISDDPTLESSDAYMGVFYRDNPNLAVGASYTRTETVTIPATYGGARYLLVGTDRYRLDLGGSNSNRQGETNENNNTLAIPIALQAPDLAVIAAESPQTAVVGEQISVSWTVQNIGATPTLANWGDAIYLSTNATKDSGDTFLGNLNPENLLPLAPDGTYTLERLVTLPQNRQGDLFLLLVADDGNAQGENSETNNVLAVPIALTAPDLVPVELDAPAGVVAGQTLEISWTVENAGTVPAFGYWYDSLYYSTDENLSGADVRITVQGIDDNAPLAAGDTYTVTATVTIPATASLGEAYLILSTDHYGLNWWETSSNNRQGETNENNNRLVVPIRVVTPNLKMASATAPAEALVNQTIDVLFTVENTGTDPASGFWTDRVYLSVDQTLSGSDRLVGNFYAGVNSPVAGGGQYTVNGTVTLPADLTGARFLLFVADGDQRQGETDETDNLFAAPITINAPNLVIGAAIAPASAVVGGQIDVSFKVTNSGSSAAVAAWSDRVYLSDDQAWDAGDRLVASIPAGANLPLAAAASYTVQQAIVLPSDLLGSKFLIFVADGAQQQGETSESDNVAVLPIELSGPNLVLMAATAPATGTVNQTIQVSHTVGNTGVSAALSQWEDRVYLSNDAALDGNDRLLTTPAGLTPLAAGGSYTLEYGVMLPADIAGSKFLLFVADGGGHQGETSESDNVLAVPIVIDAPNLIVSDAIAPLSAAVNQTINVSFTVTNTGTPAAHGPWNDLIFISADGQLGGSDRLLKTVSSAGRTPLNGGAAYTVEATVVLPSDLTGEWHLLVVADGNNEQGETDNADNLRAVSTNIVRPDLTVTAATAPAVGVLGQQVSVSWTVQNTTEVPAAGNWLDYVFISDDETFDGADQQVLSIGALTPLAGQGSYTISASPTIPATALGNRYLLFVANAFFAQGENNQANNVRAVPIELRAADLVVSQVSAPAETLSGRAFGVTWTITNMGNAAVSGSWVDDVFLSADAVAGGDQHAGSFGFTGTLAPGQSITRTHSISTPVETAGERFVVVRTDGGNSIVEANELNNVAVSSASVKIVLAPQPNLRVQSATATRTAAQLGQQFGVDWVVENVGTGPTNAPYWKDYVYLSADESLDETDRFLGEAANTSFLNVGETYSNTAVVSVQGVSEGNYYILVKTDATQPDRVDEVGNEGDNVRVGSQVRITLPPPPDLIVTSVQAPEQAFSGQLMNLAYRVENVGPGSVGNGVWYDRVYLSADEQFDAADTLVATLYRARQESVSDEPPFDVEYTSNVQVRLPVALTGSFHVFVQADGTRLVNEYAFENNNTNFDATPVTINLTPPPDLEVESITAPATITAGVNFDIEYTVANRGATRTPNERWSDAFYLSADDTLDPATDILLGTRTISYPSWNFGGEFHEGGLDVDGTYSIKATLKTAVNIEGGFRLFVVTDRANEVFELDNANNVGSRGPVTVEIIPPDLVVTDFSADATADAGSAITVSWTVINDGPGRTLNSAWYDRIIASRDDVLGNGDDTFLRDVYRAGALDPGASYSVTGNVAIPFAFEGDYHLFVVTDAHNHVYEKDADGNNSAGPLELAVGRRTADLLVEDAELVQEDGRVRVTWSVRNTGENTTNSTYWYDGIYLSRDGQIGGGDELLSNVYRGGQLAPDGAYTRSQLFLIPAHLQGEYQIIVRANNNGEVDESGRMANNVMVAGLLDVDALRVRPDLVVHSVEAPFEAVSGHAAEVSWTVHNAGDPIPPAGPFRPEFPTGSWVDRVYLSFDQVLDPGTDLYLGERTAFAGELTEETDSGQTYQTYTRTASFQIPAGLSGPFYVFVMTDRGSQVAESDEGNNASYNAEPMLLSLAPPADLALGLITIPESASLGASLSFTYVLENLGANDANGSWSDRFYLSKDQVLSPDDVRLGSRYHTLGNDGPLPAGGSLELSHAAGLPAVTPGEYYLLVRTDAFNQVPESDETNNFGGSLTQVTVSVPEIGLVDGFGSENIEAFFHPEGMRTFFFRFDAEAGQTLAIDAEWLPTPWGPIEDVGHNPRRSIASVMVAHERVPTSFNYDFIEGQLLNSGAFGGVSQQVIIPRTQAGTYYIRLDLRDQRYWNYYSGNIFNPNSTTHEEFDLTITRLPFTLTSVSPSSAGNVGEVTFELEGTKFTHCSAVELVSGGTVVRSAVELRPGTDGTAMATFDTAGLAPGEYALRVTDHDGASSEQPLTVVAGAGARVDATLRGPSPVRRDRNYVLYVNYGNSGDTDGIAPLLLVENFQSNRFGLSLGELGDAPAEPRMIQVMGIANDGEAGVLRPGQLDSVPVFFNTSDAPGHFRVYVIRASDDRPLAFEEIEDQFRPEGIADELWAVVRDRLEQRLGSTWGSYVRALAETATDLADRGYRTNQVDDLFKELFNQALTPMTKALGGFVLDDETCEIIAGATLRLVRDDGSVVRTVTNALGQYAFEFEEVPEGPYTLLVDAPGRARYRRDSVVLGSELARLNVKLDQESVITGTVSFSAAGPAASEASVTAVLEDESGLFAPYTGSVSDNSITLGGLMAGVYRVTISRAGYVSQTRTVAVGAAQTTDMGEVHLAAAGSISGIITSDIAALTASQSVVGVFSGDALVQEQPALALGQYVIEGLPAGVYTLRVTNAAGGFATDQTVTLGEGAALAGIDLRVLRGAVLAGNITLTGSGQPLAGVMVVATAAGGQTYQTFSDADGAYRLEGLAADSYQVGVPGSTDSRSIVVDAIGGAVFSASLSIAVAGTLSGRVTRAGDGVANALVHLLSSGQTIASSLTNAVGEYHFHITQAGVFDVMANAPGMTFTSALGVSVETGANIVENMAAGDGSISVTVLDGAVPAADAVVMLSRVDGGTTSIIAVLVANASGQVAFPLLAAGTYRLAATLDSLGASGTLNLAAGQAATLSLSVQPMHEVSGTVRTAVGTAIEGARLVLVAAGTADVRASAISLADGSYAMPAVGSGTYDLVVYAGGHQTVVQTGVTISGTQSIPLAMAASTTQITGRVVTPQGVPLHEAAVSVSDALGRVLASTLAAADGTFTVTGVNGTGLRLTADVRGFVVTPVDGLSVSTGGNVPAGDVLAQPAALAQSLVPVAVLPGGAVTTPPSAVTQPAANVPGWLDVLLGDQQRRIVDEVMLSEVPDRPAQCDNCIDEHIHVLEVLGHQTSAWNDVKEVDDNIDTMVFQVAGLAALETAVIAGAIAAVYVGLAQIPALTGVLGVNGVGGTVVGSAGVASAGSWVGAFEVANNAASIIGAIDALIQVMPKIAQAVSETEFDLATMDAANLIQQIRTLFNSTVGIVRAANPPQLGNGYSAFWVVYQLVTGAEAAWNAATFTETRSAFDLLRDLKNNRLPQALNFYDWRIQIAQQRLANYLNCLAECLPDDDPNNPNNNNNNPNLPQPGPDPTPPVPPTPPGPPGPDQEQENQYVQSSDPNDIIGPAGFGEQRWISRETPLPYMIRFENEATATAPAQRVIITQQLDADLDYRTFRVDDIGWAGLRLELPGNQAFYQGRVDLDDALGFDVDVTVSIDTVTGLATWILQAVDPETGEAPDDALAGFLPPNDESGIGEGFVTYTIRARRDAETGDVIDAEARIIFDTNEPIDTPPIFNTLDVDAPSSAVTVLPSFTLDPAITVTWTGEDAPGGSALAAFNIYVSDDGGPFLPWLEGTQLTEAVFTLEIGHTYAFYSVAADYAGNVEPAPPTPDAIIKFGALNAVPQIDLPLSLTANEGASFTLPGTFLDPDEDAWTATVDWGDGNGPQPLTLDGKGFDLSHAFPDDGTFNATVKIDDGNEGVATHLLAVTVENVAPTVTAPADANIGIGTSFTATGSFGDPGADDWTATVDWGEGAGPQPLALVGKSFSLNHAFAVPGTHSVTVAVNDGDGGAHAASFAVRVLPALALDAFIVNDGSAQRSTVDSMTISFSHRVTLAADAFTLVRRDGGSIAVQVSNPSGDGRTFILSVPRGSLPDGVYDLLVRSGSVRDEAGQSLEDGDRTFTFHRLFGDGDGDRDVDMADYLALRAVLGTSAGDEPFRAEFDADGDDTLGESDVLELRANFHRLFSY